VDERVRRVRELCERSVFDGDVGLLGGADDELAAVEADLALVRGQLLHRRFLDGAPSDPAEPALFARAVELYRAIGDPRGEAEARCWVGIYHQVARRDDGAAVPELAAARDLAIGAADKRTLSYALRHLGIAEHAAGNYETAERLLTESAELRREIGFTAGVAANLVGLVYIAAAQGRRADGMNLADEAADLADASGAAAIARQVEDARATL
jgi:tetratricopeptide (TPR) repeat protein